MDKKLTGSDKIAKWQKEKLGDKNYNEIQEKVKHDSEIVKALEERLSCGKWIGRGYLDKKDFKLLSDALDLINRLQAEKQYLEIELQAMRGAANSYKAEVERLTVLADLGNMRANDYRVMRDRALKAEKEVERLGNAYKQCAWERDIFAEDMKEEIKKDCSYLMLDIKTIKTQAYKEFVERLNCIIMWSPKNHISITVNDIDNLLKEMVGEDNASKT